MNTLEVENIRKEFKLTQKQKKDKKINVNVLVAVDNLSLKLESGKIYGLLGPNGAGKTTALRVISSLIKPLNGTVLYNGKDIYESISQYRKEIGFLTSELKLDDFFTPNYTFTYMSKLYGMDDDLIEKKKEYLFSKFGVNSFQDVKIQNLSTGMKQKVSLAISLCHDPNVIIFDEPTNGLDIVAAKDIEDFLVELKKDNKIILISTHIFSLVEKLCDEVGIIIDGKLVIEGDLKEITKERTLEEVFFDVYRKELD